MTHSVAANDERPDTTPVRPENWKAIVLKYQRPSLSRALWQLVNTVGGYALVWVLMYWTLAVSYWLTAALALLGGGLLVRMFIIFHDCGHGSFFKSKLANDVTGFITGVLTFTPYYLWRKEHAVHHGAAADLDRRGVGDIPTMTVEEYQAATGWQKLGYRLVRNPVVLFGIAPLFMFLFKQRLPVSKGANARERHSVHWTNVTILAVCVAMSFIFGLVPFLILQLATIGVAGAVGTWLFYVQHQFEGVYWEREEEWDFAEAALKGSSFYKLPRVLQWFSGNIGFHHIHHLSPRIPNYNLERCHNAEPLFQTVPPITFFASFRSMTFRLWDEQARQLVGFGHLRQRKS